MVRFILKKLDLANSDSSACKIARSHKVSKIAVMSGKVAQILIGVKSLLLVVGVP